MEDGLGLKGMIPALQDRIILLDNQQVYCVILNGKTRNDKADDLMLDMPALKTLTDAEICNLLNYLNETWRKDPKILTIKEVELLSCKD